MGFNVPVINRDSEWCKQWFNDKVKEPQTQKKLILIVVSVALLLDNMLYMVIVPIIPTYLRGVHTYERRVTGGHNETIVLNGTKIFRLRGFNIEYENEDVQLGWLFASKALLQIFVNPFSGYIIDRIGYEVPMIIGLCVMFTSTAVFALGRSYGVLFFARSLQGLGSAFADTSGLAMIADRFSEENERSAALGIALAFISFGCLIAPPFGSVLYYLFGKPIPFMILALICLFDGLMVFMVVQPKQSVNIVGKKNSTGANTTVVDSVNNSGNSGGGEKLHGTPMWQLFMDPFIAICSGALIMANISLSFLEPTITTWIVERMPETPQWMFGLIWFPPFFPHVLGVYATVKLMKRYRQKEWLFAVIGLAMEGLSCFVVPFTTAVGQLIIPLSTICFGMALIDTSLLPTLAYLVDTRHVSIYGSVYAIADISYSLAYAFGPIVAGGVVSVFGFMTLNIFICILNLAYLPVLAKLRKIYVYEQFKPDSLDNADTKNVVGSGKYENIYGDNVDQTINTTSTDSYQAYNSNSAVDSGHTTNFSSQNPFAQSAGYSSAKQPYDPLNPDWS